jgi:hypothetical protein
MLGLESHGAWTIVREELEKVLDPSGDPDARALHEFFMEKTMPIPGFMGMRLIGRYIEVSLVDLCKREQPRYKWHAADTEQSHVIDVPNFVLRT